MKRGQIVFSKAGRDKGKAMVVLKIQNEYIFVTDGKEHPIERPKRKNPKHLEITESYLCEENFATNRAVKKSLIAIMNSEKGVFKCQKKI